jgi:hypothetical protein
MMEAASTSEMLVEVYQITQCNNPKDKSSAVDNMTIFWVLALCILVSRYSEDGDIMFF